MSTFRTALAAALLAAFVIGCGGGSSTGAAPGTGASLTSSGSAQPGDASSGVTSDPPAYSAKEFSGDAGSLRTYRNTLTEREVRSFLMKTAFGGEEKLVELGVTGGLDALVNKLVDCPLYLWPTPSNLSLYDTTGAPHFWTTPWKQAWLNEMQAGCPLRERIALHLDNWFAQRFGPESGDWRNVKGFVEAIRTAALGNFRDFVHTLPKSYYSAMWLNNAARFGQDPLVRMRNPDLNYARELVELGLLGTFDPDNGQPNYTDDDIFQFARALSGYQEVVHPVDASGVFQPRTYEFKAQYWDPGNKTIFKGKAWEKTAAFKAPDLIDEILYKVPNSSRYIAAKFYSLLVGAPPTAAMTETWPGTCARTTTSSSPCS